LFTQKSSHDTRQHRNIAARTKFMVAAPSASEHGYYGAIIRDKVGPRRELSLGLEIYLRQLRESSPRRNIIEVELDGTDGRITTIAGKVSMAGHSNASA
jgi:hypothetical protein